MIKSISLVIDRIARPAVIVTLMALVVAVPLAAQTPEQDEVRGKFSQTRDHESHSLGQPGAMSAATTRVSVSSDRRALAAAPPAELDHFPPRVISAGEHTALSAVQSKQMFHKFGVCAVAAWRDFQKWANFHRSRQT